MGRPETIEDYLELQRSIFGQGQKWIVALDVLATSRHLIQDLQEKGAGECLAIAASRGTGDPPDPDSGPEPIVFDLKAGSMMEGIWGSQELLANLPDDAVARVDAFDPEGEARVIGTIFDDGRDVAGRRKFGRRLDAWRRLEDKVVVDELWAELGIPHAPFEIVDANYDALADAASRLDRGMGTVWSGDASSGFHGGAQFTRWVRSEAHGREAADHFDGVCERARVMPFLEGIPCSIHGIVFPDYVIAGRPCEMLVLRHPESSELRYATAASFWDPPADERARMREIAKKVGEHLRETVDFRGSFTIDGVMTSDGFRPTELNPRFGGALGLLVGGMGLGLIFIDLALMEGVDVDWNPAHLEEMILENADANRRGNSNMILNVKTEETTTLGLDEVDGEFVVVEEDDDPLVQVLRGPASAGTYMRLRFSATRTPVGPSTAPLAARVIRFLDDKWDLGIGPIEPAKDVTS